jgi:hypothetical protein
MDYHLQRCSRRCAATGRELLEGETFFSALVQQGREVRRLDYSANAWSETPDLKVLAWWKSQVPSRAARKPQMAPNDVLLEYFQHLETREDQAATRYVLALLLIRRRVVRLEAREECSDGSSWLVLHCPRDDSQHRVRDVSLDDEAIAQIEEQLKQLLYSAHEVPLA